MSLVALLAFVVIVYLAYRLVVLLVPAPFKTIAEAIVLLLALLWLIDYSGIFWRRHIIIGSATPRSEQIFEVPEDERIGDVRRFGDFELEALALLELDEKQRVDEVA
jgi:hypothetical protein